MNNLNIVPYEIEKNYRNLPEVPPSENPAKEDAGRVRLPVSRLREQKTTGVQTENRQLVKDQTKSETPGEGSVKRSCDTGPDSEAENVSAMRNGTSLDTYSCPSSGLQKEIGGGMAVPEMPPRRTFERRDLVLAEPTKHQVANVVKVHEGEARESTPNQPEVNIQSSDSRGDVQPFPEDSPEPYDNRYVEGQDWPSTP